MSIEEEKEKSKGQVTEFDLFIKHSFAQLDEKLRDAVIEFYQSMEKMKYLHKGLYELKARSCMTKRDCLLNNYAGNEIQ